VKLSYNSFLLPFEYPFTISKGTKTHQPTLVVELSHMGITGVGEAPAINYYNTTTAGMIEVLEAKKVLIEKFAFTDPERYWHYLHHLLPAHPFVVCALDIAAWDLYGKLCRKPLHALWGSSTNTLPVCDYTIGIDSIEKMLEKIDAKPWPVYKVKLGTPQDIDIIQAIRNHTDATIRIDANAAWSISEALERIDAFQHMNIEFIEQPLAKDDWEGMKTLMDKSPIPLIADESCVSEKDVMKCHGHFHGINIKLTKCSGLTPALRMIEEARDLGLKVMVGSMNESTIGSAAIAHLLPQIDYVDMDGPMLLSEDLADGLVYNYGKVTLPDTPGLGISLHQNLFSL